MLIDPWFVGELTFGGQDWVYRGRKRVIGQDARVNMEQVIAETDVMVITQVRVIYKGGNVCQSNAGGICLMH